MAKPLVLRALNGAGAVLRGVGLPLLALDADALCARAARTTGLDDFGDERFRAPLHRLVRSYEDDAQLTLLGRKIVRDDLLRLLQNRLRMEAEWRRQPAMGDVPIRRPLFVLGLPRTGTSILHELLAQDPAVRVPMTWEVMHPWPPPERATYDSDPRIAQVERHFAGVDQVLPGFKQMHPMGALLPQECVAITAQEFTSILFHTTAELTSYQRWLERADLRPVYAQHRRWLQYLQWRVPAERWVLKSPGHLWALDALLAVYPDACIVQTHRDPLEVVASLTSLVTTLRSLVTDAIDPVAIGADWTERLAAGLASTMAVRGRGLLPSAQVFDCHFGELMRDEIAMVRRIYEHFGWTLSTEAEARMRAFLRDNAKDKHGAHRYTLAAAGLEVATERRRYAAYQERHGIPSENVE